MSIESVVRTSRYTPRLPSTDTPSTATTNSLTAAVRAAIPSAAYAGIHRDQPSSVDRQPCGDVADILDRMQTDSGDGPSLAALRERHTVAVDIRTDRRWATFNAHAHRLGIGAVLSLPLTIAHCTLGTLTLYALTGRTFTLDDETIAATFADRAALALLAEHHHHSRTTAHYEIVDPATGVATVSHTITSPNAFTVFIRAATNGDRESSHTADEVVARFSPGPSGNTDRRMAVRVHCATLPTVVELAGTIDTATAPYLHALLGLPPGDVIVDLTRVTFLNCEGLTQLLRLHTHLITNGATLRLTGARPDTSRLIAITDLHKLSPFQPG